MTQAIATEVKDATKRPITQADLRLLRLRMTVALLRRAVADKNADSDLLFRVADLACQAFKDLMEHAKTQDGYQRLWRAWHWSWWALKWADEGMTDLVRSAFEDAIASVVT
jgi:hypothetical protein